jgi:hypothetical protein
VILASAVCWAGRQLWCCEDLPAFPADEDNHSSAPLVVLLSWKGLMLMVERVVVTGHCCWQRRELLGPARHLVCWACWYGDEAVHHLMWPEILLTDAEEPVLLWCA